MKRNFMTIPMLAIIVSIFYIMYPKNSFADVKKLYDQKCAMCHGLKGEGNDWLAKSLVDGDTSKLNLIDRATAEKTDAELKDVILNGLGRMPAPNPALSKKEVDELIKYIRALQKK